MAGIFERLSLITRSKVNSVLDALEGDGEQVMEQTIVDAKMELAKIKKDAATVIANEKRYESQYNEKVKEANKMHSYAAAALKSGNEGDARKCLEEEKKLRTEVEELAVKLQNAKAKSEAMKTQVQKFVDQIQDAEDTMREVKANNRVANATESANRGAIAESRLAKFDQLAERSSARYEAAMGMAELEAANTSFEEDMAAKYGSGAAVDDSDLDALRAELGMTKAE